MTDAIANANSISNRSTESPTEKIEDDHTERMGKVSAEKPAETSKNLTKHIQKEKLQPQLQPLSTRRLSSAASFSDAFPRISSPIESPALPIIHGYSFSVDLFFKYESIYEDTVDELRWFASFIKFLNNRIVLEVHYAKELATLEDFYQTHLSASSRTSRRSSASQVHGDLDSFCLNEPPITMKEFFATFASQYRNMSTQHHNTGSTLYEEIYIPLHTLYEKQVKFVKQCNNLFENTKKKSRTVKEKYMKQYNKYSNLFHNASLAFSIAIDNNITLEMLDSIGVTERSNIKDNEEKNKKFKNAEGLRQDKQYANKTKGDGGKKEREITENKKGNAKEGEAEAKEETETNKQEKNHSVEAIQNQLKGHITKKLNLNSFKGEINAIQSSFAHESPSSINLETEREESKTEGEDFKEEKEIAKKNESHSIETMQKQLKETLTKSMNFSSFKGESSVKQCSITDKLPSSGNGKTEAEAAKAEETEIETNEGKESTKKKVTHSMEEMQKQFKEQLTKKFNFNSFEEMSPKQSSSAMHEIPSSPCNGEAAIEAETETKEGKETIKTKTNHSIEGMQKQLKEQFTKTLNFSPFKDDVSAKQFHFTNEVPFSANANTEETTKTKENNSIEAIQKQIKEQLTKKLTFNTFKDEISSAAQSNSIHEMPSSAIPRVGSSSSMFTHWIMPSSKFKEKKKEYYIRNCIKALEVADAARSKCRELWLQYINTVIEQCSCCQRSLLEYQAMKEERMSALIDHVRKTVVYELSSIANQQYDWQSVSTSGEKVDIIDCLLSFIKQHQESLDPSITLGQLCVLNEAQHLKQLSDSSDKKHCSKEETQSLQFMEESILSCLPPLDKPLELKDIARRKIPYEKLSLATLLSLPVKNVLATSDHQTESLCPTSESRTILEVTEKRKNKFITNQKYYFQKEKNNIGHSQSRYK